MESAEQSLPLGNGDVGANVWLDRTGTLHLLFSKTDSWTELNRLVKTGHFSLALSPNPFAEGARFTLCLADGMLRIQAEKASVSLYADANAPCVRLLAETEESVAQVARLVGYELTGSFIRLFKKEIGMTPGQYRDSVVQREK